MARTVSHFFRFWFPVVLYCLALFIQSSYPAPEQIPRFVLSDKLLHFAAYAVLGVLVLRALLHSRYGDRRRFVVIASIVFTALYGASDELHQYFVPSRQADWGDLLFDTLGAWFGVWFVARFVLRRDRLERI